MSIDPKDAARIAKAHGLTLSDARALAAMAESEEDATELAAQFAPEDNYDAIASRIANRNKL